MRRGKIDKNQNEIVKALRNLGAVVSITSSFGSGFPDIVVSYMNRWFLIEIKDGNEVPSKKKLTPDEDRFHAEQRAPVYTIYDTREALMLMQNENFRENKCLEWKQKQIEYFSRR
jgi:hypothetical protein